MVVQNIQFLSGGGVTKFTLGVTSTNTLQIFTGIYGAFTGEMGVQGSHTYRISLGVKLPVQASLKFHG